MKIYCSVFLLFFILGWGTEHYVQKHSPKATLIWWPKSLNNIENITWYPYLQSEFKRYGYLLKGQNIHAPQDSEIVIWAYPKGDIADVSPDSYLVGWLMESPLSLKQPMDDETEQKFDLILTYRTDLVDNKKSFFVRIFTRINDINLDYWQQPKSIFVSQIASNMPGQGYEERRVAAKWFLENASQDFNLYGQGWERIKKGLSKKAQTAFNQRYKGYVEDKPEIISKSKFVLAYENAIQSDYVSEKIYDVLSAGAVPVYLGAPNILRYIPQQCFINKNDFQSYDDLYDFLKNMDDKTYESYRQCAVHFVQLKELKQTYILDQVVHHIFENKPKNFRDLWNWFWVAVVNFLKGNV